MGLAVRPRAATGPSGGRPLRSRPALAVAGYAIPEPAPCSLLAALFAPCLLARTFRTRAPFLPRKSRNKAGQNGANATTRVEFAALFCSTERSYVQSVGPPNISPRSGC